MDKPYADKLGEFTEKLKFQDLPSSVVTKAKLHFLDTIGVGLASVGLPFSKVLSELVDEWGGKEQSTVWGYGLLVPSPNAALVNASMVHGNDYDDTHPEAIIHVSTTVVPTTLAVAEGEAADGKSMITAAIAASEALIRIGQTAAGKFHERGYHPTGVAGAFGATIAAGKLLGLNSDQIANAMGIAGSQAAGLQEFMQVGSWIKRFHPGWASHAGIIAAQMASRGFTGPKTVFEGKFGLYRSHLGNARYNLTKLNGQLGKRWELLNISFKPYPCCNFSHAFMDCAFDTIRKSRLKLEDVKEITCKIHPTEAQLVMEPRKLKQAPKTEYDAKFSLPYSIGLLLVEGEAGTQQFTPEKLKDPKVLEVARKVKYTRYNDPFFPRYFPGWVVITTKNGKKYQNRITKNHGTKENPMSRSEIVAKFKANASRAISHEKVNKIIAAIDKLEQLPSASELTDLLS